MGLRIKTNVESVVAQRRLDESRKTMMDSLEKLSSGQRINKSADDAAGLAVSEQIRARVRSMGVAKGNANDGISYIQVAEGGLNEVTNIMVRMRELTSQAATDTIGERERGFLDREFQQLRQEISRITDSTEFNGAKVLKADDRDAMKIFVGSSFRGDLPDGSTPEFDPEKDSDILSINFGELRNLTESLGKITDEDISISGTSEQMTEQSFDVLNKLDSGLNSVASYRASLGAVQSRLNSTITNIDVSNENLLAAQSRIRDVDYASESARNVQARILSQAGISVLTQANSTPEMVLSLLRT